MIFGRASLFTAVSFFASCGTALQAAEQPVGKTEYIINEGGGDRKMVISGKAVAMRGPNNEMVLKRFTTPLKVGDLRGQLRETRLAQPMLREVNYVLSEPAANLSDDAPGALLPVSCLVHVTLKPNEDVDAVAASVGVTQVEKPKYAPGQYVFHSTDQGGALALMEALRAHPAVKTANAMLIRPLKAMSVPNDPYFAYNAAYPGYQWHLNNTGQRGGTLGVDLNVLPAWETVRGSGMLIGIVDDGVEVTHPDLAANHLASASWNFGDNTANLVSGDHGTVCAGIVVAVGNNNIGGCGVAHEAKFASLRLGFGGSYASQIASALAYKNDVIPIKSNSYGNFTLFTPLTPLQEAALLDGVTTGRGGLGTIFVFAAGNDAQTRGDTNYSGYTNSIYTIPISGVNHYGEIASYASYGDTIVASGVTGEVNSFFQSLTTTDREGSLGYNPRFGGNFTDLSYTNSFNGTSATAPQAAGIAAMMLQTNPGLGWRDVKEILMMSCKRHPEDFTSRAVTPSGLQFKERGGAGILNAGAAVNMAATWRNLGPQITWIDEQIGINRAIAANASNATITTFTVAEPMRVEHVTLKVAITHASRGGLQLYLISPSGNFSHLKRSHSETVANLNWTFSSVQHWGENPVGTWKVVAVNSSTAGTLNSATMTLYGATPPTDGAPFVTQQPADLTAPAGGLVYFGFTAIGKQPMTYQWKKDNVVIPGAVFPKLTLNVAPSVSAKYSCVITNSQGTFTTNAATFTPYAAASATALSNSVDTSLGFVTSATLGWANQTAVTHDGVDALKSAAISDMGSTSTETLVMGPATVSFWWKVNSELNGDFLSVSLDDMQIEAISGDQDWTLKTIQIGSGFHRLKWTFAKDSNFTSGPSAAYLDQVTVVYSGYAGWMRNEFAPAQQIASFTTGTLDDPDKDGVVNLLEYALALDPESGAVPLLPQLTPVGANVEFTYVVDTSKTDVQLTPETTDSLDDPWTSATPVESAINGTLRTMKVIIPANNGKAFVRLRVVEL